MRMAEEPVQPDTPLYNSRIILSFIKFVEKHYDQIDIGELLRHVGMARYQVEDDNYWFTQEQVDLFYEHLVAVTKNEHIARDVGRYSVSTDSLGLVKSYALGFANPQKVCEMIKKAVVKIVRSCDWDTTRLGPNKIEITVTPKAGTHEKQYQCENRIGYIESIFSLFKHKLPRVDHTECVFKGGSCCRYTISWHTFQSERWRTVQNYLALPLSAASLGLIYYARPEVWVASLALSCAAMFALSYKMWHTEKEELVGAVQNLTMSTDTLFEKLDSSSRNAYLIHELGLTLTRQRHIDGILEDVAKILERRLEYDRCTIFLADRERKILSYKGGFGHTADQLALLRKTNFRIRPESKGVLVACFQQRKPILINDLDEIGGEMSTHSLEFAREMGVTSFICCPILCVDDVIGVLAFDNVQTKRRLLQSDIDILTALSPEIGLAIQNALVTDLKERQFNSILEVLASSIDARDPLTAGHSQRVTRFAMGIASELDLPKDYCEMIRVASLLHDYGKIGVSDSILKKNGSLTPDEYREIKTHAVKTKEILDKIEFDGIYKEIPEIAASHHEKWDGTGYPKGLKFEEIPLGARILAVADVFEAITSVRHYRDPMPLYEAFGVLASGKNKHFDPVVVDAFIRYYVKQGQTLDSLARNQIEAACQVPEGENSAIDVSEGDILKQMSSRRFPSFNHDRVSSP